ncbi:hypothetical protein [Mycobacterium sp.]|uniref:DprA-like winged helix domain-containing protein n=1 Tax=Mycobacterium sp. TaxID=1785 RepID=UPI0031DD748E
MRPEQREASEKGEQGEVYEALPGRGTVTVDQIAVASGLAPAQVFGPLAMLEVGGLAQRRDGSWGIVRPNR